MANGHQPNEEPQDEFRFVAHTLLERFFDVSTSVLSKAAQNVRSLLAVSARTCVRASVYR